MGNMLGGRHRIPDIRVRMKFAAVGICAVISQEQHPDGSGHVNPYPLTRAIR